MNQEEKLFKKQYKKAKHKAIRPWKGLTITMIAMTGLFTCAHAVVGIFDNTFAVLTNDGFYKLKNEDSSAQYFKSDFESNETMVEKGKDVCYQVEAEGATLLMNNGALPLAKGSKVSTFSSSSVNLVYGGTGSGNVDSSTADTLKGALEKSEFQVNETLWNFYLKGAGKKYVPNRGGVVSLSAASVLEAPWSVYDISTLDSVKEYGDAAIVTLSRVGGEGADLTYKDGNYLALNEDEKDMMNHLKTMKSEGTIKNIVVLINSANPLQVDFLKSNDYDVDAVLWIGDVGINGLKAVTDILNGDVNPSGKLVDTYCYDNYSSPAMKNFTPITYKGYKKGLVPSNASTYMVYQEGIYVGYKYYESRYYDYVMGEHNPGDYNYGNDVAYPFGYGLSYSTYSYSKFNYVKDDANKCLNFSVTVANNGAKAGKNTVEIYLQKPTADKKLEVSAVQLVGFAKTGIIDGGKTEEVTISVPYDELTTYDSYGAKTYVMDAGDYHFTIANGAHEAANNFLAFQGKTISNSHMDSEGNRDLVKTYTQSAYDDKTYSTSFTGEKITNQLSDADINLYEDGKQKITYLSRYDWAGTFPTGEQSLELTDKMIKELQDVQYNADDYEKIDMPKLGQKNGVNLYDLIGKDYDDPLWDSLLDELTFDEMVSLIGDAFHWTMPCESINAPGSRDENGPQGLTASLFGNNKEKMKATAFTSEDVMAATFNRDLMGDVGNIIGNNCLSANVAVLYGTGNNIHRTPYGGRNFEYYSEDGFLSGEICAAEVKKIEEKGVHVCMKHFALNDCEQDRIGLGVWLNEQSAREIYLKAYEAPFEKGNANGVMVAYTRWGTTWSGANKGLMTNILRKEWGSNGLSITDNVLTTYVNGVDGIMAGVSIYDAMLPYVTNQLPKYENDAVIVDAMKTASHRNLYALANSIAMNGIGENTTVVRTIPSLILYIRAADIISVVLLFSFLGLWVWRAEEFKKTDDYKNYKAGRIKK